LKWLKGLKWQADWADFVRPFGTQSQI